MQVRTIILGGGPLGAGRIGGKRGGHVEGPQVAICRRTRSEPAIYFPDSFS